jgi:hypothetical protein
MILYQLAAPTRDDEDVVRHGCRARDSQVIGVARWSHPRSNKQTIWDFSLYILK